MSSLISVPVVQCWENSSLYVMARLLGVGGALLTQSSISSITYYVYDTGSGTLIASAALTVSAVLFDTLQTPTLDARWTADRTGYNFGAIIPAAAFPRGGRHYQVEIIFTPAAGDPFPVMFQAQALDLLSH